MSESKSFWEHPIEKLEEALSLRKQIAALQEKLGKLWGGESEKSTPITKARGGKRVVSKEARERMAAAQRARWARVKGPQRMAKKAPPTKTAKKKGGITPEGRAKLAAAMKARWAARKKGASAPNASR